MVPVKICQFGERVFWELLVRLFRRLNLEELTERKARIKRNYAYKVTIQWADSFIHEAADNCEK